MSRMERNGAGETRPIGGLVGWLAARLSQRRRPAHRLELLERIALAPRQSLALIEAEGRRLLVATSAEGPPAFYNFEGFGNFDGLGKQNAAGKLDGLGDRSLRTQSGAGPRRLRRVSW